MSGFIRNFILISILPLLLLNLTLPDNTIKVYRNFSTAKEHAKRMNSNLVAVFISEKCEPCEEMIKKLDQLSPGEFGFTENSIITLVDMNDFDGHSIASYYKIQDAPHILVFDAAGRIDEQYRKNDLLQYAGSSSGASTSNYQETTPQKTGHQISSGTVESARIKTERQIEEQAAATIRKPEKTVSTQIETYQVSYQIQFGYFGSKENADRLLVKLSAVKSDGSYIAKEWRDGKSFYRVLSHPIKDQHTAEVDLDFWKRAGFEAKINSK